MRAALRVLVFPLLLGLCLLATWALVRAGLPVPVAATAVAVVQTLLLLGLERVIPYRVAWVRGDGQTANDLGHTLAGTAVGAFLGDSLNGVWAGALAAWASEALGSPLWPTSAPFPLQVVGVFLLADLGRYWQHRLHHRFAFWWRFHELHHDVRAMGALKASRSHLVERLLQQLFMFGPLLALGAPREVLWWFIVPNSFLGAFAHCNVDLRLGPLEFLVMGPANHRLHHAVDLRQSNANFSSALVVWDVVFGTWLDPHRETLGEVGVTQPTPQGFVAQLVAPMRRPSSAS
ncbi:MAG: sterol desaturase family protein [Myxococcaceae bacterium]|nr:sterol desaturase family protein [Myxococcaceae bacterium]